MILTILETLPVLVVGGLLGAWAKHLYDEYAADMELIRERRDAMRAAREQAEREQAERERAA